MWVKWVVQDRNKSSSTCQHLVCLKLAFCLKYFHVSSYLQIQHCLQLIVDKSTHDSNRKSWWCTNKSHEWITSIMACLLNWCIVLTPISPKNHFLKCPRVPIATKLSVTRKTAAFSVGNDSEKAVLRQIWTDWDKSDNELTQTVGELATPSARGGALITLSFFFGTKCVWSNSENFWLKIFLAGNKSRGGGGLKRD